MVTQPYAFCVVFIYTGLVGVFLHHPSPFHFSRWPVKAFITCSATCCCWEASMGDLLHPRPWPMGLLSRSGTQLNSFEGRWSEFNFFRLLMSPRPCCRLAAHITPARRPRPRAGSIAFLPLPFYYRGSLAACASGWISPFRAPFRGIQSCSGTTGWVFFFYTGSLHIPP